MRIVLLNDRIPPENRGGAGIIVWHLAQALHQAGHQVHVIAATDLASFEEVRSGIPTYHLHVHYPERWRAWLSLYNPNVVAPLKHLFEQIQPDVVHAHNIHTDLTYHALHIARQYCQRLIFTSHDAMPITYGKLIHYVQSDVCPDMPASYRLPKLANLRRARLRYNPFRAPLIRRALAGCDVRIAVSQALADAHHANGLPQFTIVHNGIDPDTMASPAQAVVQGLRERLDLGGRRVMLLAGRLNREKGVFAVLDTLDQVRELVPDVVLLVLSQQPLQAHLPAQYHHLIGPSIYSAGWLSGDDLSAAYQLADVILVPSIYLDPFPTINLEAMSARRAVIATCHGGSPEVVVHDETGIIVNPLDADQFAHAIIRLLSSPALAEQFGQAGRKRLEAQFSMQQHLETLLQHYHQRNTSSI